jgi:hypothetical protein
MFIGRSCRHGISSWLDSIIYVARFKYSPLSSTNFKNGGRK